MEREQSRARTHRGRRAPLVQSKSSASNSPIHAEQSPGLLCAPHQAHKQRRHLGEWPKRERDAQEVWARGQRAGGGGESDRVAKGREREKAERRGGREGGRASGRQGARERGSEGARTGEEQRGKDRMRGADESGRAELGAG
eukprot:285550-Pleurochrysis_carterae.AAC.1